MDWVYTTGALFRDLQTSRVRRLLSILGVVIGTAAVISSLAVVEGGREQLRAHLEKLGVNLVVLEDRFRPDIPREYEDQLKSLQTESVLTAGQGYGTPSEKIDAKNRMHEDGMLSGLDAGSAAVVSGVLRLGDVKHLRKRFLNATLVEPITMQWAQVGQVGARPFGARVEGGTPHGAIVRDLRVREGRYLLPMDVDRSEKVCVLGVDMAKRLLGEGHAVGRYISMLGSRWRVIGILERKGTMMRFNYDRLIIVPITAMHERTGVEVVNALLFQARDKEAASIIRHELLGEVMACLPGRMEEDFSVFSQDDLAEQHDETLRTFKILTICVAAFSLLVSGIGIMNIMLVSVRERTHEIGVWKAVGATDLDILSYFLAESVLTCLLGGGLGILLGVVLAADATGFVASSVAEISSWKPIFCPEFFVLSLGSTVVIGLLSGIFPAIVAARLEPTEALRYE
ncbi:MAG: ABC transporter permease [Verrucomicrobia bacterium]|jgi:putative ABC transport system permease protein|nr:ABC transporter permease [Verrucomicrobiota bacterium]